MQDRKTVEHAARKAAQSLIEFADALASNHSPNKPTDDIGIFGLTMVTSTKSPRLCLFNIRFMVDAESTEHWVRAQYTNTETDNKILVAARRFGVDTMGYHFVGYFDTWEQAHVEATRLQTDYNNGVMSF